jgi:hypothetical protein
MVLSSSEYKTRKEGALRTERIRIRERISPEHAPRPVSGIWGAPAPWPRSQSRRCDVDTGVHRSARGSTRSSTDATIDLAFDFSPDALIECSCSHRCRVSRWARVSPRGMRYGSRTDTTSRFPGRFGVDGGCPIERRQSRGGKWNAWVRRTDGAVADGPRDPRASHSEVARPVDTTIERRKERVGVARGSDRSVRCAACCLLRQAGMGSHRLVVARHQPFADWSALVDGRRLPIADYPVSCHRP